MDIWVLIPTECTRMNPLLLKGGYGEHGRNCYLIPYKNDRYVMLDCGIMDSDPNPFPRLSKTEVGKVDYLILSHGHKDHTGALGYVLELGFDGYIIASWETLYISGVDYGKTMVLDAYGSTMALDGLTIRYGRSGHCPGSFWFSLRTDTHSYFYSGDYQKDPLVYAVDVPKGIYADIALVDMAHDHIMVDASALRTQLIETIGHYLNQGRKVVLPVQTYGRGNEMLVLLQHHFPNHFIFFDQRFVNAVEMMLQTRSWMKPEIIDAFIHGFESNKMTTVDQASLFLIADTHLEKQSNQQLVESCLKENGVVIVSGRRKSGSYCAKLLDEGKAIRCLYPHHSSRSDAMALVESNDFKMVLPFHCDATEVWMQ